MPLNIVITPDVHAKLDSKHQVKPIEVEQCFLNSCGQYFEDDREEHKTDPCTWWFVSETDKGRLLKVVFVDRDGNIYLKSAFAANERAQQMFAELCTKEK